MIYFLLSKNNAEIKVVNEEYQMLDVSKAVDEATKITLKYRYIDLLLRD
jgi:hypothetical protein